MMTKRRTGYAAAALAATLMMGTVGTTYGATLTLAGFGADQEVKETTAQTEAAQAETAAQTEAAQTEAAQAETTAQTEAAQAETAAEAQTEAAQAETAAEAQTEAAQAETAAEAQTEAVQAETAAEAQAETAAEAQTEAATEAPLDKSMVDTTGFAKESFNVFVSGDTEGEVVGHMDPNDSMEILDVDEYGWYKVRSGNVEGYVPGYLVSTGEEAEATAQETAYTYAQVGAETLNVRLDASEEAEVLDTVGQDASLEVVEDLGDWKKVVTEDGVYGYVASDYVSTETVYPTGETVQEQSEREEQEYIEQAAAYEQYVAEQEAAAAETAAADAAYTEAPATDAAYTEAPATDAAYTEAPAADAAYTEAPAADAAYTDTTVSAASSDVDALYQAYLAAHEASLSCTDEADAAAKANASIEAYNAYLAACGSSQTVAAVEAGTSETTTTTTETTTADTTTYQTEAPQTEAPQTEAPQTEAAAAASTGSSTGAAIAAYACQFVGNPYVYGGTSLTSGADCSGFTMSVFANFGISLPHNAAAQSGCGTPVSTDSLQPGDLVFYGDGGIGHVAIYIGNGSVVHASNEETGIKYSAYNYRTPVAAVRCC